MLEDKELKIKFPNYFPAVDLMRGEFIDQRFFAIASLFKMQDIKCSAQSDNLQENILFGEHNNYPFFLRSLLKPIQASIMADYSTQNYFQFSDEELAIMQASHSGEKIHTALIESILNKAGLNESYLQCPEISPLNPDVLKLGDKPKKIHNNCSGKHSMMLAASKQLDFPLDGYTNIHHPLQKLIKDKIIELSEFSNPPQTLDGCTVPVWALPFKNIALAFFKLYNDKKYNFLKTAYMKNPYTIGGTDASGYRQDTHIMQLNSDLISKTGAGGFLSVYNNKRNEFLLIKMAQDNNKIRLLLAMDILKQLGWIYDNPCDYNFYNENNNPVGVYRVNFNFNV